MKRGNIVIAALSGDYGKPRPALVVQTDMLVEADSILLAPITSDHSGNSLLHIPVKKGPETGLRTASRIMVEKTGPIRRIKIASVVGRIDEATQDDVDRILLFVLGLWN